MWLATIKLGVTNLLLHKLRSFLTMLGTILGVASVISMLAIGEGSKQHAVEQIRQLGASNVIVRSVKPGLDDNNSAASDGNTGQRVSRVLEYGLLHSDYDVLTTSLASTIKLSVPISLIRRNAQHGRHRITNARILGTTPEFKQVKNIHIQRGRFLTDLDLDATASVVVLSEGAARRLFTFEDPLGQTLLLGEGAYRVVGVLAPQSSGNATPGEVGQANLNNDLYIPLSAARSRFGELQVIIAAGSRDYERTQLSEITLAVNDERFVSQTAAMARKLLERSHPEGNDFEIQVPLELLKRAEREKRIWNLVLGSIAGISLLVGGIGIMNIMLATVTERTREIGIRRAIGARRKHIIAQFLVETMVLSTVGGMLGIVLGVAIPLVVTMTSEIQTVTSWWSVLLAFGISVSSGVVFGVYPARRAAMMNPIEALRHQ